MWNDFLLMVSIDRTHACASTESVSNHKCYALAVIVFLFSAFFDYINYRSTYRIRSLVLLSNTPPGSLFSWLSCRYLQTNQNIKAFIRLPTE